MAKDNNANKRESRQLSEEIRDLNRENHDIVKDTYDISKELTKCLHDQNEALGIQKGLSNDINDAAKTHLESQKKSTSHSDNLTQSIQQQAKAAGNVKNEYDGIEKQLRSALNVASDFTHALGLKDLGKVFDIIERSVGKLSKAKKAEIFGGMAEASKKAGGGIAGGMKALQVGFRALGPILTKSLGPLALVAVVAKAVKLFVDLSNKASKQTADLTRNQLISRDLAREMYTETLPRIRDEYNKANAAAGVHGTILKGDLLNAQKSINDELGFQFNLLGRNNEIIEQSVAEVAKMVKHMGLSQKTASRLFLESQRNNVSLQDQNKELAGNLALMSAQEGVMVDVKKVINEAASITGRLRANFGFSVKELAKAVFEAKLLGLSLSQVDKAAGGLLDFQSSIKAEMEAEVLLGKELNFEQARFYSLTNQTDKLAGELAKTMKSIGGFSKLNRIEQEALSKAYGISVDELADIEQKQMDVDTLRNKSLEFRNDLLKKGVKIKEDELDFTKLSFSDIKAYYDKANLGQDKLIKALGDEAYQRMNTLDAQQRFNESLASAKEQFTDFVSGGSLDKLAAGLERFVSGDSTIGKLFGFGGGMGASAATKRLVDENARRLKKEGKTGKERGISLRRNQKENTEDFGNNQKVENTEDFIIRPNQPVQKFRKDDVIIGGTNLDGKKGSGSSLDNTPNKDIQETNHLLRRMLTAIEQGSQIYVDGKMLGQSIAQTTSRLG